MAYKMVSMALTLSFVSACGGSEPEPYVYDPALNTDSAVQNADGSYTVNDDGLIVELPATGTANGQPFWFSGGLVGGAFESDDVLAIGGTNNGSPFAAISGTPDALAGSGTFVGRYTASSSGNYSNGPLELSYDFDAQTLTTTDGDLDVNGSVDATGAITGTVTHEGADADFDGGFYGGDSVAGAFQNDTLGGIFYGTQ